MPGQSSSIQAQFLPRLIVQKGINATHYDSTRLLCRADASGDLMFMLLQQKGQQHTCSSNLLIPRPSACRRLCYPMPSVWHERLALTFPPGAQATGCIWRDDHFRP